MCGQIGDRRFVTLLLFLFFISLSWAETLPQTIIFERKSEPRENAFTVLVPRGWQLAGGIYRVDPTAAGGSGQSIAAKVDFAVKSDAAGTIMIRWLPDVLFFDMRNSPAGQMGLFPQGSNYNGMTVYNLMPATQFLQYLAFPYAHPGQNPRQILQLNPLPQFAQNFQQRAQKAIPGLNFTYDAALLDILYDENGIGYREKMVGVVENWGQLGAGLWGNKETILVRAPENEYAQWEPVFKIIQQSVKIDLQWLMGELKGQLIRGGINIRTQEEMQKIGRDIAAHRQQTNAEIQNDMYLTLTSQEEYVNPFTQEIEVGTDQWQHRWTNEQGDIIYTNDESYRPNEDVNLHVQGFKKSAVRKRFPQ